MPVDFLHNHQDFPDLLRILESEKGIQSGLIEKDYWIMHVLFGLKQQGFVFELKGGTSLSKGFNIIERFSEDIDIHIKPPAHFSINENPKNNKAANVEARRKFYDWLAVSISINGIVSAERDTAFDHTKNYTSGGIRLHYKTYSGATDGVKSGILLEAGFDNITPNTEITISSWAYERAVIAGVEVIDNRAIGISCYNPGYTFVEKLQTVATKFRKEMETGIEGVNFMRQYYDITRLLANPEVLDFIGTEAYQTHKRLRFPKEDFQKAIQDNEAFRLSDPVIRERFRQRYRSTAALYYNGQPDFYLLLEKIKPFLSRL